jgi:hypothetical protein
VHGREVEFYTGDKNMADWFRFSASILLALLLAGCGGGSNIVSEPVPADYTGNWAGVCKEADTSLVPTLGPVYYHDLVEITADLIVLSAAIFMDSDCVTPADELFVRSPLFEQGTYTLGEAFTTETGLIARPLVVQATDTGAVFENIIALSEDTLYFGFNPLDGPGDSTRLPLRALELEEGYRRR